MVLLHGYGAPGDDLVSLGERLRGTGVPASFVVPAATFARPGGGRMWFERQSPERGAQIARSRDALDGVVSTVRQERGEVKVVLAGFSQGAMMSLDGALRGARPAAVVLLSGAAPAELGEDFSALRDVPVFVSHGREDAILPFAGAEAMVRRAEEAGAQVTFVPFDGGHAIPPVVVEALSAFLRRVL